MTCAGNYDETKCRELPGNSTVYPPRCHRFKARKVLIYGDRNPTCRDCHVDRNKHYSTKLDHERTGDWFMSLNGHKMWPLDPDPLHVELEEIAHALSLINRFGGHMPRGPYSVAQHSVIVAKLVAAREPRLGLLALMHDAPEYVLGDVIRPLKRSAVVTAGYGVLEKRWGEAIGDALGFEWPDPLPEIIKKADDAALMAERRELLSASSHGWRERENDFHVQTGIVPLRWELAKREFIDAFFFFKEMAECATKSSS